MLAESIDEFCLSEVGSYSYNEQELENNLRNNCFDKRAQNSVSQFHGIMHESENDSQYRFDNLQDEHFGLIEYDEGSRDSIMDYQFQDFNTKRNFGVNGGELSGNLEVAQKPENQIKDKFEEFNEEEDLSLKQDSCKSISYSDLKNYDWGKSNPTNQLSMWISNLSKDDYQSYSSSEDKVSVSKEDSDRSNLLPVQLELNQASQSQNLNSEELSNTSEDSQEISTDEEEHKLYLVSEQNGHTLRNIIVNALSKGEAISCSEKKKGRPKKSKDTSKEAIQKIFDKNFKKVQDKLKKDHRIDSRTSIVARAVKGLPDDILKYVGSVPEYKNKDIKVVLAAYLQAYKVFISHFGDFNNDIYQGFYDFITLKFPETRVNEIIDNLVANCSISSEVFIRVKDQLKIRTKASKALFSKLYKMNSCYKFISQIIIEKVTNIEETRTNSKSKKNQAKSESNINRTIKEILDSIRDFWEYEN